MHVLTADARRLQRLGSWLCKVETEAVEAIGLVRA
jgi:hypothetical protein